MHKSGGVERYRLPCPAEPDLGNGHNAQCESATWESARGVCKSLVSNQLGTALVPPWLGGLPAASWPQTPVLGSQPCRSRVTKGV